MIILAHHLVAGSEVVGRHGGRDWPGSSITSGTMDQGVQWDVPIAHSGGQQRPLYSPATWEPESSDKELDQTEYTQDPLAFPSRPLSQSTSEGTRLVPRPKGAAKSSSSAGQSCADHLRSQLRPRSPGRIRF